MEDRILKSLKDKQFHDLSQEEMFELRGLVEDEQSFDDLKYLFKNIPNYSGETVRSRGSKERLDELFKEVHGEVKEKSLWATFFPPLPFSWNFSSPVFVGAIGSLVIGVVVLLWFNQTPLKDDTKFVEKKPEKIQKQPTKENQNQEPNDETQVAVMMAQVVEPSLAATSVALLEDAVHLENVDAFHVQEDFQLEAFATRGNLMDDKIQITSVPTMSQQETLFDWLSAAY
jgi:hypothetical protein